ncbi:MAG: hypothetical protein V5A36_04880, partial [Natronomonas sp.]
MLLLDPLAVVALAETSWRSPARAKRAQGTSGPNAEAAAGNAAAARSERPDGDLNSGPWLRKPRG